MVCVFRLKLLTNKKILTGKAGQWGWINPLHPVHVCHILIFIQKVILCNMDLKTEKGGTL